MDIPCKDASASFKLVTVGSATRYLSQWAGFLGLFNCFSIISANLFACGDRVDSGVETKLEVASQNKM